MRPIHSLIVDLYIQWNGGDGKGDGGKQLINVQPHIEGKDLEKDITRGLRQGHFFSQPFFSFFPFAYFNIPP